MNGLYSLVEFDEGDKWFVAAEKEIENTKYSYLVRVDENEEDFIDEFQLAKSVYDKEEEYMITVTDKEEEKRIIPILIPESKDYFEEVKKLKSKLNPSN